MEINLFLFINLRKTIDYQLFFCYYLVNNRGGYEYEKYEKIK